MNNRRNALTRVLDASGAKYSLGDGDERTDQDRRVDAEIARLVPLVNDQLSVEDSQKFLAAREGCRDRYALLAMCRIWAGGDLTQAPAEPKKETVYVRAKRILRERGNDFQAGESIPIWKGQFQAVFLSTSRDRGTIELVIRDRRDGREARAAAARMGPTGFWLVMGVEQYGKWADEAREIL